MLAADAGWFLDHAYLIALVPGIAFAVIILIGKRLPYQGAEVGIASMVASLVLAAGTAWQWIDRVDAASHGSEGGEHASLLARAVGGMTRALAQEGEHAAYVEPVVHQWTWWESGGIQFGIGHQVDGLSMMLLLLVAFISTLVQIYSLEYMRGDRRFTHFFASLTLFSAGMMVMVMAPNMVQLILGWEIMGLCSFMLIGHWWEDAYNQRCALKAFFTVRVGDVGLLVGTAILFGAVGSFDIRALNAAALDGSAGSTVLLWASVALFIACIGKSGQFPLHTWLPDAMAGPTPVSSLLHSSTMVVGGVFLVARLYPVFHTGLEINVPGQDVNLIAVIGGITIVIAALLAFVQSDIKKVLAYSTVSQLGYMMMGLGVGAWLPAVFHIFTHAFFKCCLFLCAGSISHTASHHSFDMKQDMGGLRKRMPITFWTWILSTAALCGVPFFSGFFSKDEIIDNARNNQYTVFFVIGLIGAFLTTAYMTRATYLTFFGQPRGAAAGHHEDHHGVHVPGDVDLAHALHTVHDVHEPDEHEPDIGHDPHDADEPVVGHPGKPFRWAPQDSPKLLVLPLMILAALAVVSGYLNAVPFGIEHFSEWVSTGAGDYFPELVHAEFEWVNTIPSIVFVAAGLLISLYFCRALFDEADSPLKGLTQRNKLLGAGHTLLVNKYYLDALYEGVIVRAVAHPIAQAAYWTNQKVIDGAVNGVGIGTKLTGRWVYRNIDQRVVDGAVNGSGAAARGTGSVLRPVQSGRINQYTALLFAGAAVGALVLVIVNT
jgi:NADH-quinone oxidoreductase subunit L